MRRMRRHALGEGTPVRREQDAGGMARHIATGKGHWACVRRPATAAAEAAEARHVSPAFRQYGKQPCHSLLLLPRRWWRLGRTQTRLRTGPRRPLSRSGPSGKPAVGGSAGGGRGGLWAPQAPQVQAALPGGSTAAAQGAVYVGRTRPAPGACREPGLTSAPESLLCRSPLYF